MSYMLWMCDGKIMFIMSQKLFSNIWVNKNILTIKSFRKYTFEIKRIIIFLIKINKFRYNTRQKILKTSCCICFGCFPLRKLCLIFDNIFMRLFSCNKHVFFLCVYFIHHFALLGLVLKEK